MWTGNCRRAKEKKQNAQFFIKHASSKIRSRTHQWKDFIRNQITGAIIPRQNSGNTYILGLVQWGEVSSSTPVSSLFNKESYDKATYSSERLYKSKPIPDHLNAKFRSIYNELRDVSVYESWMMRKGHLPWKIKIPSICAIAGIKSFKLCEVKCGHVGNVVIYNGQATVFTSP
jgi:hypothetical protein